MSFQQCRFNFGRDPFRFPPADRPFRTFNEFGSLSEEERIVLPRYGPSGVGEGGGVRWVRTVTL